MSCDAAQFSDQMVCPCGLRWDVNDPEPPACPYSLQYHEAINAEEHPLGHVPGCQCLWCRTHWSKQLEAYRRAHPGPLEAYRRAEDAARASGIAVHELSDREVSQAQRRLSMLYEEPGEAVWRIVDTGSKWFMWIIVIIGAFVVGWSYYGPVFSWVFKW